MDNSSLLSSYIAVFTGAGLWVNTVTALLTLFGVSGMKSGKTFQSSQMNLHILKKRTL